MILAHRICFYVGWCEPDRFEALRGVQLGLVKVVWGLRIFALPEYEHRLGTDLGSELCYGHQGMSLIAVPALLSFNPAGLEVKHDTEFPPTSRNRQAGPLVAEGFLQPCIHSLQPIRFAPGDVP